MFLRILKFYSLHKQLLFSPSCTVPTSSIVSDTDRHAWFLVPRQPRSIGIHIFDMPLELFIRPYQMYVVEFTWSHWSKLVARSLEFKSIELFILNQFSNVFLYLITRFFCYKTGPTTRHTFFWIRVSFGLQKTLTETCYMRSLRSTKPPTLVEFQNQWLWWIYSDRTRRAEHGHIGFSSSRAWKSHTKGLCSWENKNGEMCVKRVECVVLWGSFKKNRESDEKTIENRFRIWG